MSVLSYSRRAILLCAADVEISGEGDLDLDKPLPEDDEDDSARREILNGALVKEVSTNFMGPVSLKTVMIFFSE